jgi:hypothetical protein
MPEINPLSKANRASKLTVGVCRTHYMRDLLAVTPKSQQPW